MRNLDFYIEKAMKIRELKSKRQLCIALGVSHNAMNDYKRGAFPSDTTMIKLAELANEDVNQALLELNVWRSPAIAQKPYIKMLKQLTQITACLALFILSVTASTSAYAGTKIERVNNMEISNIHYHIYLNRFVVSKMKCDFR